MSGKQYTVRILENKSLCDKAGAYLLKVAVPTACTHAVPGQFLHILCGNPEERPLRRAFSICASTQKPATLSVCYHVVGDGTAWLAERAAGEEIDILAPLGHGFSAYPFARILLVGEGRGMFALLAAAKRYGARAIVMLAFPSEDTMHLTDEFRATGAEIRCYVGTARERIKRDVRSLLVHRQAHALQLAASQTRMKTLAAIAAAKHIPCEAMLTPKLACGVGACRGCTRLFRVDGQTVPRRICKDGPVFHAPEILWDSKI